MEETDRGAPELAVAAYALTMDVVQGAARKVRIEPGADTAAAVAAIVVEEYERDAPRVAVPSPAFQLVVRFGAVADGGVDVHAMGVTQTVHRKVIRGGQRSVSASLRLGAHQSVLGVPASELAGRIVALDELWGNAVTRRLRERLASARGGVAAASVLERAIAERLVDARTRSPRARLALRAAEMLGRANVGEVAGELGVSERHLRRAFREVLGMSPKAFAKLSRFERALGAADGEDGASWASIAAASGYYDQAHLIAEFRAIAGATPRAFVGELRAARASVPAA